MMKGQFLVHKGEEKGIDAGIGIRSSGALSFLMDGENFFPAVRNALVAAANNTFDNPPLPSSSNLIDLLKAVASAGNDTYVLLWDSGNVSRWIAAGAERLRIPVGFDLQQNKDFVRALNKFRLPHIHAALEAYVSNIWTMFGESNHQKIIIVSVAEEKVAFVAGFNLESFYWDTAQHPDIPTMYAGCHDTAVLVSGPIAGLVEEHFDARWRYATKSLPGPKTTSYVKVGYWGADPNLNLDPTGTSYRPPMPATPGVSIDMLRTATYGEHAQPLTQVRDALIESISFAQRYLYFENLTFYDVPIVRAVCRKLASVEVGSAFQAIIVVPQPVAGDLNDAAQGQYNAFTKIAILSMKLYLNTWVSFETTKGRVYEAGDYHRAEIEFYDSEIENTVVNLLDPLGEVVSRVYVRDIAAIVSADSRVVLCGPARYFTTIRNTINSVIGYPDKYKKIYIHSKLALIDDEIAFVGSANYSTRSMEIDGEIALRINDKNTATFMRQTLLAHWGITGLDNWAADMRAFASTTQEGVGCLPIEERYLNNEGRPSKLKLKLTEI